MIAISDLLSRKGLHSEISSDKTELSISKVSNPQFVIFIYGNFDIATSPKASVLFISVPGYHIDDIYAGLEYSSKYEEILHCMLNGDYTYSLQTKNIWDRLIGGGIYVQIGNPEHPVITTRRCDDQMTMKQLYKQGALQLV